MLAEFLRQAREDRPVYITDVRRAFQSGGTRPFHIHVRLYDGTVRQFPLRLPETRTPEEAEFVRSYVHAMLYNILSSLGAGPATLPASRRSPSRRRSRAASRCFLRCRP